MDILVAAIRHAELSGRSGRTSRELNLSHILDALERVVKSHRIRDSDADAASSLAVELSHSKDPDWYVKVDQHRRRIVSIEVRSAPSPN